MEEIEEVSANGRLRYCGNEDTFVGQDPKAPLKNNDRNVAAEFFVPADMCSHFCLFSHGGGRDPTKCFCTARAVWTSGTRCSSSSGVQSSSTVGKVAKAHSMKVETLWMMNAGFDPTGQLLRTELADNTLFFKTLPLK